MVIKTQWHGPAFINCQQEEGDADVVNDPERQQSKANPGTFFPCATAISKHKGYPKTIHTIADATH